MTHFGDRLTEANRRTATPLCMGIDPHISMIPAIFGNAQDGAASDAVIRAIDDFSWGNNGDGQVDSVNGFLVPGEKLKHDTLDALCAGLRPVSYTHLTLPTKDSV